MFYNRTYQEAKDAEPHLIALGETQVYVKRDDPTFPFDKVTRVECGISYRLNMPSSMYVIAEDGQLEFKMSVDFEDTDANGRGTSRFDRDRLRELMLKLPVNARRSFCEMLETKVLNSMSQRTNEIREALRHQLDSEDCVRGLIAFAQNHTTES